jgi:hypothetical protein
MYAVPSSRSYAPTLPNNVPGAKARVCSTTNRTTRACDGPGAENMHSAPANTITSPLRFIAIPFYVGCIDCPIGTLQTLTMSTLALEPPTIFMRRK